MTATEDIIRRIRQNAPISTLEFFELELTEWIGSSARKEMLDGERYYAGGHDILHRRRTAIGNDGALMEVKNLANNRLVDNQYAKHADQKKNYLLGKPLTFESENKRHADEIKKVLGKKFMRTLKNAGCEAICGGIAWLYPYYDAAGSFCFRMFPSYEILPFWRDAAHTELDCACRLYQVEEYTGREKKLVEKVDIFQSDGVTTCFFSDGKLTPDPNAQKTSYITVTADDGTESGYNWERVPLIPIKYNAKEIPLIRRTRQLQDAINLLTSDFVNNMQEDVRSTVIVLSNHDGTDLGEFRRNLATYGVIKVRTVEGISGGAETLNIKVNAENYKTALELLKKSLIENARSYDAKDDRLSGSPNQMNIQSMYSDIDLDANDMETELQASFEDILWFVNRHLTNTGVGDFDGEQLNIIFNRDMLINETEAISNCAKSEGIISNETIVGEHPWTRDPAAELARIAEEKRSAEADTYRAAFEQAKKAPGVTGDE